VRAWGSQAVGCRVKRVREARFAATRKRLMRQLRAASPPAREPAIIVATSRGAAVLPLHDIDWIEAADNYVRLWTGGRSYLVREPLDPLGEGVRPDRLAPAHRRTAARL